MWQCAIPTFEGLLPTQYDKIVMTLLYRLAEWHALAKLRMHTDTTLDLLDSITTILGRELRQFRRTVCSAYATKDLPKEHAAHQRKSSEIKRWQQQIILPLMHMVVVPKGPDHHRCRSRHKCHNPKNLVSSYRLGRLVTHNSFEAKQRMFSLWTYKLHSLGDYVRTIRALGTTDSYSTQTVSLPKLY